MMNWLESIFYSLVTAAAQLLPVSAQAHRSILEYLFGAEGQPYLLSFLVHLAVLAAVCTHYWELLGKLSLTNKLLAISPRRRKRQPDPMAVYTLRLFRTAMLLMLPCFALLLYVGSWRSRLEIIALTLVVNGILLFIPAHMPQGNKNAKGMSGLESVLVGLASGLGCVPGLSRVGLGLSAAISRGADPQEAVTWSMLLTIPATIVMMGIDVYQMVMSGIPGLSLGLLIQYLVSAAFSYISAYFALIFLKFMSVKLGFSGFSYYCWGAALFAFILYMI